MLNATINLTVAVRRFSLVTALLLLAGCGGSTHPKTYPVRGELFVQGQPAAGARVILHPEVAGDQTLWPHGFPQAVVNPEGKFQFGCFADADGAPAGNYKLLARWDEDNGGATEDSTRPPPKNRLADSFFDAARSPWSVTVEPKTNQLTRFEVP
ncbi:hypothetical protein [Anatilimnocola floriformis]|uniref:hypothetical protein n=1 Tax=Anatilimnocola floriformis TaxID=2948575 RepID=UPI0020C33EAB|nr:hypothetical protein [Anatilimnocola floriformis]